MHGKDDADEALMLAYRDGDADAFSVLYERHRAPLFRYIRRQCGATSVAEELFQDVWTNLIRSRTRYRVDSKFTTFLPELDGPGVPRGGDRAVGEHRAHHPARDARAAGAPAAGGVTPAGADAGPGHRAGRAAGDGRRAGNRGRARGPRERRPGPFRDRRRRRSETAGPERERDPRRPAWSGSAASRPRGAAGEAGPPVAETTRALAPHPAPEAWLERIRTLLVEGRVEAARRSLEEFARVHPGHPIPAPLRARIYPALAPPAPPPERP